jgi:hypothetical protein
VPFWTSFTRPEDASRSSIRSGGIHRDAKPLLHGLNGEGNAWILNDPVNNPLHDHGAMSYVPSFLPHWYLPPALLKANAMPKLQNRFAGIAGAEHCARARRVGGASTCYLDNR